MRKFPLIWKDFSLKEYHHAKIVSDIAYRCAKEVGCNANLCLAAGFYYRIGKWLGEPYTTNILQKSHQLCFSPELTQILLESVGETPKPTTPESALIHMVDTLVKKFEVLEKSIFLKSSNIYIRLFSELSSNLLSKFISEYKALQDYKLIIKLK